MTMLSTIRSRSAFLLLGVPLAAAALAGIAEAPASAAAPERFPIRAAQVLAVLHPLNFDAAEMKLLAQLSASTAAPELEVKDIAPWGERGARVRLACRVREECLPFYVSLLWPSAADAQAALHAVNVRGPGMPPGQAIAVAPAGNIPRPPVLRSPPSIVSTLEPGAPPAERAQAATLITSAFRASAPILLAGSHATLLLDGARLHIKVPVICLEKGVPGRTIRVSALDHKQTYFAEVVDATLLKGTL